MPRKGVAVVAAATRCRIQKEEEKISQQRKGRPTTPREKSRRRRMRRRVSGGETASGGVVLPALLPLSRATAFLETIVTMKRWRDTNKKKRPCQEQPRPMATMMRLAAPSAPAAFTSDTAAVVERRRWVPSQRWVTSRTLRPLPSRSFTPPFNTNTTTTITITVSLASQPLRPPPLLLPQPPPRPQQRPRQQQQQQQQQRLHRTIIITTTRHWPRQLRQLRQRRRRQQHTTMRQTTAITMMNMKMSGAR